VSAKIQSSTAKNQSSTSKIQLGAAKSQGAKENEPKGNSLSVFRSYISTVLNSLYVGLDRIRSLIDQFLKHVSVLGAKINDYWTSKRLSHKEKAAARIAAKVEIAKRQQITINKHKENGASQIVAGTALHERAKATLLLLVAIGTPWAEACAELFGKGIMATFGVLSAGLGTVTQIAQWSAVFIAGALIKGPVKSIYTKLNQSKSKPATKDNLAKRIIQKEKSDLMALASPLIVLAKNIGSSGKTGYDRLNDVIGNSARKILGAIKQGEEGAASKIRDYKETRKRKAIARLDKAIAKQRGTGR